MFNVKLSYCLKGKIKCFDVHYLSLGWVHSWMTVCSFLELMTWMLMWTILYLQTFNLFIDLRCLLLLFSKTIKLNVHHWKIFNIFVQALETGRKVNIWQAFMACFVASKNNFFITGKKCTTRPYSSLMVGEVQNTWK